LPFVMLLLDYWPLRRMAEGGRQSAGVENGSRLSTSEPRAMSWWRLAREKGPFFVLVAASCVVTFLAQHRGGMVVSLEEMPPGYRLENVPLAYLRYLSKIFWPVHPAIFYPLPRIISPAAVVAAVVVLSGISAAVWLGRRRYPYGWVGWLWFLGTLVPVIGLVQVGQAAMADRYTYFPSIGLFIAVAFAGRDGARRFQFSPRILAVPAAMVLAGCVLLAEKQLHYWRNDEALFTRAVKVTGDNEPTHLCLGQVYALNGRTAEAAVEYRMALKLNPRRVKTYNSLALLLARSGQTNEALAELQQAAQRFPADAATHDSLANLLADAGRTDEALAEFQMAVRLDQAQPLYRNNLGAFLAERGRLDEALGHYAEAARLDPADWRAPYLTGKAMLKAGRDAEAITAFRRARQNAPDNPQIMALLAQVLASDENAKIRNGPEALRLAARANDLTDGPNPAVLDVLAMACAELGRFEDAQKTAEEAVQLALANGLTNDAARIQQRLGLYRNRQPFRQSFAPSP
ncbi:MAG TPA: tetratricopeptide repeat protein, partial [Candidatus Acidoferrum sp.]|nr:tetratricopeptide repeat protein [Candidatus Acidoferrum sp.]